MTSMSEILKDSLFLMPNWKWLALIITLVLGLILQRVLIKAVSILKQSPKLQSLHPLVKDFLDLKLESTVAWLLTTIVWHFILDGLELHGGVDKYLKGLNQLVQWFYLLRLAYFAVDALGLWLNQVVAKTDSTLDDQLAPLATKTLKVVVVVFGVLLMLQGFGFNVMSLLAGLGLGGLALALAAQDTAANVFGSITIILDRPFQVGDWIKVGDTEGHVEEIGFRSTRIRTFYQSLVSVPNSVMAKERIDNMGVRPRRRIRHILGLTYGTPPEKLQQFIDALRYHLTQHADVSKEDIIVSLNLLGDFSLQILVQFFLSSPDAMAEELEIQQEILMDIMRIARQVGVEFAFPTHTVQLQSEPPAARV